MALSEHERTLAALEQQRRLLYEQARQFINGLHTTWESPEESPPAGSDDEAVLGAWIASQADDLNALRERVRQLQETILALREKQ
jgi:hypothetical protein